MANPSLDVKASLTGTATTYNQNVIIAGSPVTNIVLRWGDADSVDTGITNVTLPSSGNAFAPELWREDTTPGTDQLICDSDEQPPAGTPRAMMFQISTSDNVNFATAPRITVFDSSSHTDTEEFIDGTTNHSSPFIKARGQTVNTAPAAAHFNEASEAALHVLDNGTAIVCGNNAGNEENCALDGMNAYLYTSTTNLYSGTEEYFSLAASIPDDATTGVDSVDGVLTIRHTYI